MGVHFCKDINISVIILIATTCGSLIKSNGEQNTEKSRNIVKRL